MIVNIPNPWRFSTAKQRLQQAQLSPRLQQLLEIVRRQNLLRGVRPGPGKATQDDV